MIAVAGSNPQRVHALARATGLPPRETDPADGWDAVLCDNGERVELIPLGKAAPGPLTVDFGSAGMRHRRRGGHNEALGRAVGVGKWSPLSVVDGTAGLGRDSFILADLGCRVLMLESSPVVFALLEDGLRRALESDDPWLREVSGRLEALRVDTADWLSRPAGEAVDVVYLDPMFPARRKSARVKKEMWLLQRLLDTREPQPLLAPALARSRRRVVVKRPAKAPPLEGQAPSFAIPGKTVRFDVYLP